MWHFAFFPWIAFSQVHHQTHPGKGAACFAIIEENLVLIQINYSAMVPQEVESEERVSSSIGATYTFHRKVRSSMVMGTSSDTFAGLRLSFPAPISWAFRHGSTV